MRRRGRLSTLETAGATAGELIKGGADVNDGVRYEAMPGPYGPVLVPKLSCGWHAAPEHRRGHVTRRPSEASGLTRMARSLRGVLPRQAWPKRTGKVAARAS